MPDTFQHRPTKRHAPKAYLQLRIFVLHLSPKFPQTMIMKHSLIALAALAMTSCGDYLTPDGEIVECDMEIPTDVKGIEIADGMKLNLSDDVPTGTAVVRTHLNIQSYIKAEIEGDRLVFSIDARRFKDLDVTITTSPASYRSFTASGGSRMCSSDPFTASDAAITLSGGSHASLATTCSTMAIDCSGGSELTLKGSCDNADINCSGGSHCYAYDFTTAKAAVNISGGSGLEITVTESLTGENSGGSRIRYKGTPSLLTINNSGGSTTVPAK